MTEIETNKATYPDENLVKHEGIVSRVSKNSITVSLKGNLHCEACNAKIGDAGGFNDMGCRSQIDHRRIH